MIANAGNVSLAGDIAVEIAVAFSDAVVTSFQMCEDMDMPLSHEQKKLVLSASTSTIIDMRQRIMNIIELDDIARGVLGVDEEITIEYAEDDND